MDNYHTSLGMIKYLWRKSKADLSLMTMAGRVTPIGCKSGDESAQSQKWSACCWTSCILQPIQFGQLGEYYKYSWSTINTTITSLKPELRPRLWPTTYSLSPPVVQHISLSQSSLVLSFQSFVLWFNSIFHIQCCPPYSFTVFLLSLSQLSPLFHQSRLYSSSL